MYVCVSIYIVVSLYAHLLIHTHSIHPLNRPHRLGLPKGSTLVDAVALGMGRRKLATTALLEVKRALESQRDYPVMVVVVKNMEEDPPKTQLSPARLL